MLSPLLYLNGILSRYLWKNHLAINWPWNSCWINNCQSARLATFSGNCLELADIGILNHVKCQTFSCGCPEAPYYSNEMYRCRYSLDYLYGFLGFNWINILPLVLIQRFQSLIYRSCLPKCGIQLFHIGHSMSSGKVGICRTFLNIVNRLKHILDQIIQNESNNCCFFSRVDGISVKKFQNDGEQNRNDTFQSDGKHKRTYIILVLLIFETIILLVVLVWVLVLCIFKRKEMLIFWRDVIQSKSKCYLICLLTP